MTEKYKIYIPDTVKKSLIHDAELFEFVKKDGTTNLNAFLKILIVNYYYQYNKLYSCIHDSVLKEILDVAGVDESTAEDLTERIIYLNGKRPSNAFDETVAITLTVGGESFDVLQVIQCNSLHSKSLSQYLRDLFESYLSIPRNEREKIIFLEQYNTLNELIYKKKTALFSTVSDPKKQYKVVPYRIVSSKEELFNYLICFDVEKQVIRSFRLSRINHVITNDRYVELSGDVTDKLEMSLDKGPQFSFNSLVKVDVRFTEEGKRKYKMLYTNRPPFLEQKGDVFSFEWPENQMFEYIKRFGKEAEVLKPLSLRNALRSYYHEAYRIYE